MAQAGGVPHRLQAFSRDRYPPEIQGTGTADGQEAVRVVLVVSEEVREAIDARRPVVALESTI
ncbi:hypothetical protein, partial [Streptomyces broussonetiae]|uniref:hypothetical protein n=1 Tax=Streptomyces broussonetiae TaxID=2686304 RepID=UPI0035D79975